MLKERGRKLLKTVLIRLSKWFLSTWKLVIMAFKKITTPTVDGTVFQPHQFLQPRLACSQHWQLPDAWGKNARPAQACGKASPDYSARVKSTQFTGLLWDSFNPELLNPCEVLAPLTSAQQLRWRYKPPPLTLNTKPAKVFHIPWISYYKQHQTTNFFSSSPSLWHQKTFVHPFSVASFQERKSQADLPLYRSCSVPLTITAALIRIFSSSNPPSLVWSCP